MEFRVVCNKGRVRENNEDAYKIYDPKDETFSFCIVADGMGGHNGGEIASNLAVNELARYVLDLYKKQYINKEEQLLEDAIKHANRKVFTKAQQTPHLLGMGTTLTVAFFKNGYAYIGNIGDSRAYLFRNNKITQLTLDHSYVAELVRKGKLTKREARHHPQKNMITRAVGTEKDIEVDVFYQKLIPDDVIILCTDGLTNMLDDEEIANILRDSGFDESPQKLVDAANEKGGYDNITVILARCKGFWHNER